MDNKVYIFEGKTSTEAIEKGLNELKVSKNKVDIKILETEEKRSFFSILTPRVVKVEMRLKDNVVEEKKPEVKKVNKTEKIDNAIKWKEFRVLGNSYQGDTKVNVKKEDWFYANEEYDRKFDERADRNQYRL